MRKIYELPIYAITPEKLCERSKRKKEILVNEAEMKGCNSELIELAVTNETYPMRCWDYNHISGYIRISVSNTDVRFDLYLPYNKKTKYYWDGHKKTFLCNAMLNGMHFRVDKNMSNDEIQEKTKKQLEKIRKTELEKTMYVDTETFDNTYRNLDFRTIMNSAGGQG